MSHTFSIGQLAAGTWYYYAYAQIYNSPSDYASERMPSGSSEYTFQIATLNTAPVTTGFTPTTSAQGAGVSRKVTAYFYDAQSNIAYRRLYSQYKDCAGLSTSACNSLSYGSWTYKNMVYDGAGVENVGAGARYAGTFSTGEMVYGRHYRTYIYVSDGSLSDRDPSSGYYNFEVSLDSTPPVVSWYNFPATLYSLGTTNTITVDASDTYSGVTAGTSGKLLGYRVNGGSESFLVADTWNDLGEGTYRFTFALSTLPYATTSVVFNAYIDDADGNTGSPSSTITRYTVVDGGDPVIGTTPVLYGATSLRNDLGSYWRVSGVLDNEEEISYCALWYKINGGSELYSAPMTEPAGQGVWEGYLAPQIKGINIETHVKCYDIAGNSVTSFGVGGPYLVADKTPVEYQNFNLITPSPNIDVDLDAEFHVKAYDDGAPFYTSDYDYRPGLEFRSSDNGGTTWTSWTFADRMEQDPTIPNNYIGVVQSVHFLWDRIYQFRVIGIDFAGNQGVLDEGTIYMPQDNAAPVLTGSSQTPAVVKQGQLVTINATATDNVWVDVIYLDYCEGLDINSCTLIRITMTTSDQITWTGTFLATDTYLATMQYRITARDLANNEDIVESSFFVEDGYAPAYSFPQPSYDQNNSDQIYLSISVDDGETVVIGYSFFQFRIWNPWLPEPVDWSNWDVRWLVLGGGSGSTHGELSIWMPLLPYGSIVEYELHAFDYNGNGEIITGNYSITIDLLPPSTDFSISNPSNTVPTADDLIVTIHENGTGFSHAIFEYQRYVDELVCYPDQTSTIAPYEFTPAHCEPGWETTTLYFDSTNVTRQDYQGYLSLSTWDLATTFPRMLFDNREGIYNQVPYTLKIYDAALNIKEHNGTLFVEDKLPPALIGVSYIDIPDNYQSTKIGVKFEADPFVDGANWGSVPLYDIIPRYKIGAADWVTESYIGTVDGKFTSYVELAVPPQPFGTIVYLSFGLVDQSGNIVDIGYDMSLWYVSRDKIVPQISGFQQDINGNNSLSTVFSYDIVDFDSGMNTVSFAYRVDNGDWISNNITGIGDTYQFTIPAQAAGSRVEFLVNATDMDDNLAEYGNFYVSEDVLSPSVQTYLKPTVVGESGQILVDNNSRYISFTNFYTNPVVMVTAMSVNSSGGSGTTDAQQTVVYDVSRFGFWLKQVEDGSGIDNDSIVEPTLVNYMVFEVGRYIIDGKYIEVGTVNVTSATDVFYQTTMVNPAVFVATQSLNNSLDLAIHARLTSTNAAGFQVIVEEGHNTTFNYPYSEIVGYMAFEQGLYANNFEIGQMLLSSGGDIVFSLPYTQTPLGFVQVASNYDSENVIAKLTDINSSQLTFAYEEMNGLDGPHGNEDYYYMTMTFGDIYADVTDGLGPVLVAEIDDDYEVVSVIIRISTDGGNNWNETVMTEISYGIYEISLPIATDMTIEIISVDALGNAGLYTTTYRGL